MQMIGTAAIEAITSVSHGLTVSPLPSAGSVTTKPIIRLPETVDEARALKAWADEQSDAPTPATLNQLARHLEYLAVTLPRQTADDETGEKRTAVYARLLGGYPNDALAFMSRKACETLNWFPTPKQCLDILATYRAPATEKEQALTLCHRFWQGRFEDFIALLKAGTATQADVDAVPMQWRKIAMERGHLRWIEEEKRNVIRRPVIAEAAE